MLIADSFDEHLRRIRECSSQRLLLLTSVRAERPSATMAVFLVTALATGLDLAYPTISRAVQRTPAALSGEWWRLVSPILVNPHGWKQIATNLSALIVVGAIAERQWGPRWWFAFYIGGGVVGEIAGLVWQPVGAGSSVAVCGLLGSVSVALLRVGTTPARFGATLILAGAFLLTYLHDLHGPPILASALLAVFVAHRRDAGCLSDRADGPDGPDRPDRR